MRGLLVQGTAVHLPFADQSFHCTITSPPYWRLREYATGMWEGGDPACPHSPADTPKRRGLASSTLSGGKKTTGHQREGYAGTCPRCGAVRIDQQLGSEEHHDCLAWARGEPPCLEGCYICHMRQVFAEVWRVLRNDGTLWVIIGDSYAGSWGAQSRGSQPVAGPSNRQIVAHPHRTQTGSLVRTPGLKPKDLCMIPARLALALQSDGWTLRTDIIWNKTNGFPESVEDRPTRSHEYIFLFSKRAHYFYDQEAVREPHQGESLARATRGRSETHKWSDGGPGNHTLATDLSHACHPGGRNLRSVWTMATYQTPVEHYATFPPALVRNCIEAGTSAYGVCAACARPWERILERIKGTPASYNGSSFTKGKTHDARAPLAPVGQGERTAHVPTLGWQPTCHCDAPVTPAVVFDPFVGSGTTVSTALALGRRAVGLDLGWPYLATMAAPQLRRLQAQPDLFFDTPRHANGQHHAILMPQQETLL